jgi:hypothetical protein
MKQVTTSLCAILESVKVNALVPTCTLFLYHSNEGFEAPEEVAVNVTGTPWHTESLLEIILSDGDESDKTFMKIWLEKTDEADTQRPEMVILQEITSLFCNVLSEYCIELEPTIAPFLNHWKAGVPAPVVVAENNTGVPAQILFWVA